jgi:hypothetical protein
MESKIRNFLSTPIFKLIIHVCLMLTVINTIYFTYQSSYIKESNYRRYIQLSKTKLEGLNISEQGEYLNSNYFKDKHYKNEGYKLPNEIVVETNLSESIVPEGRQEYLPGNEVGSISNLDKWLYCLGINTKSHLDSSSNLKSSLLCR